MDRVVGGIVMGRWGVVILSLSCAVASCSVEAADLYPDIRPAGPVIYMPRVFDWTGIYVGGFLGGSWASTAWDDGALASLHGFAGGGQVGANLQAGSVVFGVNADLVGMGLSGTVTAVSGRTHATTSHWATTITGRLGYTFDRLLLYGKGGMAVVQDQETTTDTAGLSKIGTATRFGWAAGAGGEFAFDRHWSVFAEYVALGFVSQIINFTGAGAAPAQAKVNLSVQRAVGGVNYRF